MHTYSTNCFCRCYRKTDFKRKGIHVGAHILSIKDVKDTHYPLDITSSYLEELSQNTILLFMMMYML